MIESADLAEAKTKGLAPEIARARIGARRFCRKPEKRKAVAALRDAVGDTARRIDHIGSTSIPGLGAKPIVDIQISVPALEPMSYREPIESLGFVWHEHNPELHHFSA